jgi:hypothetical protein
VDLVQLPACELAHQVRQLDLAGRVRQHHDLGAPVAQARGLPAVVDGRRNQRVAAGEEPRIERRLEARVDEDLERLARRLDRPHRELRIVVFHRADAGENGAGARTPAVPVRARFRTGNPLTPAVGERGLAVKRGGDLHAHPRPATRHARDKPDVRFARLVLQQAGMHFQAGSTEPREAVAGHLRVRVLHRGDDAPHLRRDQRLDARRRTPVMTAGLEREVDRRSGGALAGRPQRVGFRMGLAGARVEPFADDRAVADDHAADARIGSRGEQAARRERERARHEMLVGRAEHAALGAAARRYFPCARGRTLRPGRLSSSTFSRNSSTRWKSSYTEAKRM